MRATSVLFNPSPFEPLMLVAALAFALSVVCFYKPPTESGPWLYALLALCAVGVVANAILFFAPDSSHGDATNLTFSALSIVGWGLVGLSYATLLLHART